MNTRENEIIQLLNRDGVITDAATIDTANEDTSATYAAIDTGLRALGLGEALCNLIGESLNIEALIESVSLCHWEERPSCSWYEPGDWELVEND